MRRHPGALLPLTGAAFLVLACACRKPEANEAPVVVRNPDYLVVRSIQREADAEHMDRVEFPYSGAGYGFASSVALLDLNSVDIGAVAFAGGRTSIAGEATLWLPLTPEASRRLADWTSRHAGEYLGIYIEGRLVAAPRIDGTLGGGIPLRVKSKRDGDRVMEELRRGGATTP